MGLQPLTFDAIGTQWAIYLPSEQLVLLKSAILQLIEEFDHAFSRFRDDSLVTRMSLKAGTYDLPPGGRQLLEFYRLMYEASEGRVTPLIGQVMHESGYDAHYSLEPKALHQPPAWEAVLQLDGDRLTLLAPALLDFGAAGKGLLVDMVGELLEEKGLSNYFINAGGDMRHRSPGPQPLEIGLENPLDQTQAVGVAHLANVSLCGSAGNRRAWHGYHHIIDPIRLASPTHISAVWTTASTTMVADGMSTCLYFAQPELLQQHFQFEYVVVYEDGSFVRSEGFQGELFTGRR